MQLTNAVALTAEPIINSFIVCLLSFKDAQRIKAIKTAQRRTALNPTKYTKQIIVPTMLHAWPLARSFITLLIIVNIKTDAK